MFSDAQSEWNIPKYERNIILKKQIWDTYLHIRGGSRVVGGKV